jgi:hypothetical protein
MRSLFIILVGLLGIVACEHPVQGPTEPTTSHDSLSTLQTAKLNDSTYRFIVSRGLHDKSLTLRWVVDGQVSWADTLTHRFTGIGAHRVEVQLVGIDSSTVQSLDTVVASGLPLSSPSASLFSSCKIEFSYFGSYQRLIDFSLYNSEEFSATANLLYWADSTASTDSSYSSSMHNKSDGWYVSHDIEEVDWKLSKDLEYLYTLRYLGDHYWLDTERGNGASNYLLIEVQDAHCIGADDDQAIYLVNAKDFSSKVNFQFKNTTNLPSTSDELISINAHLPPKPYAILTFKKK